MKVMDKMVLEALGHEIANALDEVQFIGVQNGFEIMPSTCAFNCLQTGTTFLTNSVVEAEQRLKEIRKSYN